MIAAIVVVEGIHDASAVQRAVEADVLWTGGFAFGADVEARLQRAHRQRGLLVLTDPDPAGAQIRRRVERVAGPCAHAHVPRELCTRLGDIGIEHASAVAIRAALTGARSADPHRATVFVAADLWRNGLADGPGAQSRRAKVGAHLGLGHGNARQLLRRLNAYGVTRGEFDTALAALPR